MTPVNSSQISHIGYNAAEQTMDVQFKSGGLYRYHKVTPEKHAALMAADSIGKHLGQNIKGKHEFTKLPPQTQK